jgi:glutamine synthetase
MAFTGNKFEFRMPGSSDSIADPNVVMNTMMAEELAQFAEELSLAEDFDGAVWKLLKRVFTEHQRILFEGNGYDEGWIWEAESRGLLNLRTTADALPQLIQSANIRLMTKHDIYMEEEITARYNVYVENYIQEIRIEARTMLDMVRKDILPAVSDYIGMLAGRVAGRHAIGIPAEHELANAKDCADESGMLAEAAEALSGELAELACLGDEEGMRYCSQVILPTMEKARAAADALEVMVDRSYWPFPTYADLLFSER